GGPGLPIDCIYMLLVILVATIFFFVGPRLARQAARLGETDLLHKVSSGEIAQQIGAEHGWSFKTRQQLQSFLFNHRNDVMRIAQRVGLRLAEAAQNIWFLVLVPVLAIFFLKDGRSFSETALSIVQTLLQRELLEGVLNDLNQLLAHFIHAQLTLAALSLMVYTAFFGMLRVPYVLCLDTGR